MIEEIFKDVAKERQRQDDKFGVRDQHPCIWLTILNEEVGEVAREICESDFNHTQLSENYRKELVEVAAVAIAAIQNFDKVKSQQ